MVQPVFGTFKTSRAQLRNHAQISFAQATSSQRSYWATPSQVPAFQSVSSLKNCTQWKLVPKYGGHLVFRAQNFSHPREPQLFPLQLFHPFSAFKTKSVKSLHNRAQRSSVPHAVMKTISRPFPALLTVIRCVHLHLTAWIPSSVKVRLIFILPPPPPQYTKAPPPPQYTKEKGRKTD